MLALAQKGWIDYNDSDVTFKCGPVVQAITRQKNPQLRIDCDPVVDILVDKLEYESAIGHFVNVTHDEVAILVRYATSLVACFERMWDYQIGTLCERIGNYHEIIGDLGKGLVFFEKDNHIGQMLCKSEPENDVFKYGLAFSYGRLGQAHAALGDLDKALGSL